jgi:predicted nucleic acid-binding protein
MTDYMVDNSIWARIASHDPNVTARMRQIERSPSDLLLTCPPQVLELCHSARTPTEYRLLRQSVSLGFPSEHHPDEQLVLDIQNALWDSGLVRAAGALDILVAGYAIANHATVLTADHDFDHIASVSQLRHEYVSPAR